MENALGFDPLIIRQLREAATAGQSATELLSLWKSAVEAIGKDGNDRMRMGCYFDEAFGWGMSESRALRVWWPFGDKPWTDEVIDNSIAPLLEEWRTSPRVSEEEAAEEFFVSQDNVIPGRWVEIQRCAFTGAVPVWVPEHDAR